MEVDEVAVRNSIKDFTVLVELRSEGECHDGVTELVPADDVDRL